MPGTWSRSLAAAPDTEGLRHLARRVAEALSNVAKHAHAGHAEVTAAVEGGSLRVEVRVDGGGGARPEGSGPLRPGGPPRGLGRPAPGRELARRRHARLREHPAPPSDS